MATGPGGLLGVFALAALVTYQLLSLMQTSKLFRISRKYLIFRAD